MRHTAHGRRWVRHLIHTSALAPFVVLATLAGCSGAGTEQDDPAGESASATEQGDQPAPVPARIQVVVTAPPATDPSGAMSLALEQQVLAIDGVVAAAVAQASEELRCDLVVEDAAQIDATLTALEPVFDGLPLPAATARELERGHLWQSAPPRHVSIRPFVPGRSRTLLPRFAGTARGDIKPLAASLRLLPEIAWAAVEGAPDPVLVVRLDRPRARAMGLDLVRLGELIGNAIGEWEHGDGTDALLHLPVDEERRVELRDVAMVTLDVWLPNTVAPEFPDGIVHLLAAASPVGDGPGRQGSEEQQRTWESARGALLPVLIDHDFGGSFELFDEAGPGALIIATSRAQSGDDLERLVREHQRWFETQWARHAVDAAGLIRFHNIRSAEGAGPTVQLSLRMAAADLDQATALAHQLEEAGAQRPGVLPLEIAVLDSPRPVNPARQPAQRR